MQIKRLQQNSINGRVVLPVCFTLVLLLRVHASSGLAWTNLLPFFTLLVHTLLALVLMRVEHAFTVIRTRTVLPAAIYLLLTGTDIANFTDIRSLVISVGFLIMIGSMLAAYQRKDAQILAFNLAFVIALCSLIWTPILLFFPLAWIGLLYFKAFTFKSFLATILGLFAAFLLVFSYALYRGNLLIISELVAQVTGSFSFSMQAAHWTLAELIRISLITVLYTLSFLFFMLNRHREKIKNRHYLYFLYFTTFFLSILLWLFTNDQHILFPLLAIPASLVIAHFFSLSINKTSSYLIALSLLLVVVSYFIDYYLPLFANTPWINLTSIF